MQEMIDRVDHAIEDDYKKSKETRVLPITWSDEAGNTIIYYVCQTTFYEEEPEAVNGLDPVLDLVVDSADVERREACAVSGIEAVLYEKDGRCYLCWTLSPEYSLAIEYSPDAVSREDIFKMAESIPMHTEMAE